MARLGYSGAVTQVVGDKILFFAMKPQVFEAEDLEQVYDVMFEQAEDTITAWRYWWDSWLVAMEGDDA